jgi:2',3'-cyclic-nucleotide 2'-phosphodiesterase (5'-nucleotidase family)
MPFINRILNRLDEDRMLDALDRAGLSLDDLARVDVQSVNLIGVFRQLDTIAPDVPGLGALLRLGKDFVRNADDMTPVFRTLNELRDRLVEAAAARVPAPEAEDDTGIVEADVWERVEVLENDTSPLGLRITALNGETLAGNGSVAIEDAGGTEIARARLAADGQALEVRAAAGVDTVAFDYTVTNGVTRDTASVALDVSDFTLELLHIADQEAAGPAVIDAPNLSGVLNALRAQDADGDGSADDNTLTLSSGDAFIPGLFFDASAAVFGSAGIADIQIQNELGIQAIALGNHEFDTGADALADLIDGSAPGDFSALSGTDLDGQDFTGTDFPYLSANLDVSTDADLAPLAVPGGQAPQSNVVTSSTVITVGGQAIGVVGATTPTLAAISSPDDVTVSPPWAGPSPTDAELDALAAVIQAEVDMLLAENAGMNKVVLLAHMQQIAIEIGLAERLENVDIVVAGGSNTRLFDENDRARDGDSVQGDYPTFVENAGGTMTAVVNTDGSYKYVGRLVLDFNASGDILPGSYDPEVSGAYATDAQGVADLNAAALIDPEVQAIADAIEAQIVATEGNVLGVSDVFLNGNRSGTGAPGDTDGVRTQETNLGNLTADANLWYVNEFYDPLADFGADVDFVVSIKNGGGIRASIGETVVPPGGTEAVRTVNTEVIDGQGNVVKPEGGISQNDIQTTLAFNNGLTVGLLTGAELAAVLEHGVANLGGGQTIQVAGVAFSFDPGAPANDRILDAAIVDETGDVIAAIVEDGEVVAANADSAFGIVTLGFIAAGGDSYPFPGALDVATELETDTFVIGESAFAEDFSEQDALAEFLLEFHDTGSGTPFAEADTGPEADTRIFNLDFFDAADHDTLIFV